MLITFKSKAAADIVMYKHHAQRILELLNKEVDRGVITAPEMPAAISILEAAIAESRAHPQTEEIQHDVDAHHSENGDDNEHEKIGIVSFATRAFPFLEMLRAANAMQREIVWGV